MKRNWTLGDATHRAKIRASPWLLVAVPLGLFCAFASSYAVSRIASDSQYLFAPDGAFYCSPTLLFGAAVIILSLLIGFPVGFTLANVCMWLVLPIRRGLDKANARANITFERSMWQLIPVALFAMLIVSPILLLVVNRNICFTQKNIAYRPFSLLQRRDYEFSQISRVQQICDYSKDGWGIAIVIETNDGNKLHVNREDVWQPMPFTRIVNLLRNVPFDDANVSFGCPRELLRQLNPDPA